MTLVYSRFSHRNDANMDDGIRHGMEYPEAISGSLCSGLVITWSYGGGVGEI